MITIRQASDEDCEGIWAIFHEVVARGDTYAFAPDTDQAEAQRVWIEVPTATYVAVSHGDVVGTYYIKANQPALGAHVCNAGYMVKSTARGQGIGRAMCEHSLVEAKKLGFSAMQYNLVVANNTSAVKLWQDLGFAIIGTIPKSFRHPQLGLIDAHVMHRFLAGEACKAIGKK